MQQFEKINDFIFKLEVPFEGGYTSVFLVEEKGKYAMLDCATTEYDVNEIILPALKSLGVTPCEIILSHSHGDHAGGLNALLLKLPETKVRLKDENLKATLNGYNTEIISDGDKVFDSVEILCLPGHCDDAVALFERRTNTLISADCVQLYGIGVYGTGLSNPAAYFNSLSRIKALPVENLIASHEYAPLGAQARGREAVLRYIEVSENYAREIGRFTENRPEKSPEEIATEWNAAHPTFPTVSAWTIGFFK